MTASMPITCTYSLHNTPTPCTTHTHPLHGVVVVTGPDEKSSVVIVHCVQCVYHVQCVLCIQSARCVQCAQYLTCHVTSSMFHLQYRTLCSSGTQIDSFSEVFRNIMTFLYFTDTLKNVVSSVSCYVTTDSLIK